MSGCVGGQDVRDVTLAAPAAQEIMQHAACQDHVCGNVGVELHVCQEAAEAVRHHAECVLR